MIRDILIGVHTAGGAVALACGTVLIARMARARQPGRVPAAHSGALAVLTAAVAALVAWDWSGLGAGVQAGFTALLALAAVMTGAAVRSQILARDRPPGWPRRLVAAVGFTLIALFEGFVIITTLDAGAPGWAIAIVAVATVLVGRRLIQRAERMAASRPMDSPTAR